MTLEDLTMILVWITVALNVAMLFRQHPSDTTPRGWHSHFVSNARHLAMIFYADNTQRSSGPVTGYSRWPAVKKYLEHYGNYLILDAISKAPKDPAEKRQALKEMTMCERKLAYWERHPNYDRQEVEAGIAALKRAW